jgi:hypothetical protein
MTSEELFSFDKSEPGSRKYWRGGPDELVNFQEELLTFYLELGQLADVLLTGNFSKIVVIGYSAANMTIDFLKLNREKRKRFPFTEILDYSRAISSPTKAIETYQKLNDPFKGGALLEDFALTGQKL